jgi:hypothetical protein
MTVAYRSFDRHNCARAVPEISETSTNARWRRVDVHPILLVHRWPHIVLERLRCDPHMHRVGDLQRLPLNGRHHLLCRLSLCPWCTSFRSSRLALGRRLVFYGLGFAGRAFSGWCVGGGRGGLGFGLREHLLAEVENDLKRCFTIDLRIMWNLLVFMRRISN